MNSYLCDSIKSGTTDWEIWVSIGFISNQYGSKDVLHIVCGFHDEDEPVEGIWLERTDQSQGGNELAESIKLLSDRICVTLTTEGLTTLAFKEKTVEFKFSKDQEGVNEMKEALAEMAGEPNGAQVHVASSLASQETRA
jgi:hypothetical protein